MKNFIKYFNSLVYAILGRQQERRSIPLRLYRYTFHLVGLNRRVHVKAKDRDAATRQVYEKLRPYEIDRLEWADVEQCEEVPLCG
jgi:hypothetical protein